MQLQTNYTGVDISKSFFVVAVSNGELYKYNKFSKDECGFKELLKVF